MEMENYKSRTYSLEKLTDKYVGTKGTRKRNEFENELRFDLKTKLVATNFETTVRAGWAKAAKEMHQCGDDNLLIDDVFDDEIFD